MLEWHLDIVHWLRSNTLIWLGCINKAKKFLAVSWAMCYTKSCATGNIQSFPLMDQIKIQTTIPCNPEQNNRALNSGCDCQAAY